MWATRTTSSSISIAACALLALVLALAGCAAGGSSDEPSGSSGPVAETNSSQGEAGTADVGERGASYVVARVEGEPDWDEIPQVDIDHQQWTDPVEISAHAQLCYGDDAFHVRMWAEEADVRAEHPESDLLAPTYEDSCLEFFLMPVPGDGRYVNFEINPNCAICVQVGEEREGRTTLVRPDDPYDAVATRTEDGWEVTYEIPFSLIETVYPDFVAEPGLELRGNFYKCGNLTSERHYLSWSPVDSDTPNFHAPWSFGTLTLG